VRIVDLARRLIVLSGRRPDQVPIVFSGPRPGEKLFEQLALAGEEATRTRHPGIWVGRIDEVNWPELHRGLEELEELARGGYDAAVARQLGALVPEYLAEGVTREPIAATASQGAGGEGGQGW
jgi:FlaA1/EpsC-like NDP-sugar epimerase